ncbi:peptidoglycan-binding protein [Streptomyces violaceusniger]|uniref:Peptidoglycan binding-like domain-containing protein n=1 Tax=Streptomyces violaceusniger TaxID=68280 RepID=A0A4D4LPW6_STRVO|nr:hypothetical protein SVIO_111210 [Streptomyces violaceusniger]
MGPIPSPAPDSLPEVRALCQELVRLKHAKGLSLDAMAHGTGYARASWHRVLNGKAFPPRAAVAQLCARHHLEDAPLLQLWDQADKARQLQVTAAAPAEPTDESTRAKNWLSGLAPLRRRRLWLLLVPVPVLVLIAFWAVQPFTDDADAKGDKTQTAGADAQSDKAQKAQTAPSHQATPTACSYESGRTRILMEGMKGPDVKQIQCLLDHVYGYPLEIDGVFGPDTLKAVETMQKCTGIKVDGQVGPDSWKYLDHPKPCAH